MLPTSMLCIRLFDNSKLNSLIIALNDFYLISYFVILLWNDSIQTHVLRCWFNVCYSQGNIPTEIGNLIMLQYLVLRENKLTGKLILSPIMLLPPSLENVRKAWGNLESFKLFIFQVSWSFIWCNLRNVYEIP